MTLTYPARLDGRYDPATSRWLWLVKFVLVIPHLIVLAFLWLAVLLTTVVSGFAILFTARYPRPLFDFAVGVLRWTWRVSFYGTAAFGTDRYPPFSLRADPAFPAEFDVDYPERLSRGLVLVKWWLLVLPHCVIIGFLAGGWGTGSGGLVTVLVVIAAVILLFTGRYPRELFDLVLGFDRWTFRVLAYAMLLTDAYPPFRLDTGGTDPGRLVEPPLMPQPTPAGAPV
jgi:hypothetical protein